jgi:hypothetical protein
MGLVCRKQLACNLLGMVLFIKTLQTRRIQVKVLLLWPKDEGVSFTGRKFKLSSEMKETKTLKCVKQHRQTSTANFVLRTLNLKSAILFSIDTAVFNRVVQPSEKDRQTCLCQMHQQFQYMASKLYSLK